MAFPTGYLADPEAAGAGETVGTLNMILTATVFENALKIGRFAKLDTASIDNIDASATPVLAGVVTRNVALAIENGDTISSTLYSQIQYLRQGIVTIDVMAADTPALFGAVFVRNTADDDAGKASTADDANTEPSTAEFLYEVQANVWAIRLK